MCLAKLLFFLTNPRLTEIALTTVDTTNVKEPGTAIGWVRWGEILFL